MVRRVWSCINSLLRARRTTVEVLQYEKASTHSVGTARLGGFSLAGTLDALRPVRSYAGSWVTGKLTCVQLTLCVGSCQKRRSRNYGIGP